MKSVAAIGALVGLAAATPLNAFVGAAAPDPTKIRIRSVGYAGTGCPQGSAYTSISADASTVTVLFDSYVATVGNGAAPSAQRRACTLQIELTYPSGQQFSVLTVRTQGYVNTDPGVSGQVVNKYFFSGVPGIASSTTNIPGNTHGNWAKTDSLGAGSTVFSPCGGDGVVNMQTSVSLQQNQPGASGYISADSIDASFEQKFRQDYGLDWIPCSGSPQAAGPLPADPGNAAPFPAPQPVPVPAPRPVPSNPYASNPYASNPYASNPYAPNPYAPNPYAPNPYTNGPSFGSPSFGSPSFGSPSFGSPSYGSNPYASNPFPVIGGNSYASGSGFGGSVPGYTTTTSGITTGLTEADD